MPVSSLHRTQVSGDFYAALEAAPQMAVITRNAFDVSDAKGPDTLLPIIGTPPRASKTVLPKSVKSLEVRTAAFKNHEWDNAVELPRAQVEDDDTGNLMQRLEGEFATAFVYEYWAELLRLFNDGGNVASYTGSNFFSATHAWGASGTFINEVTTTQVPALIMASAAEVLAPPPEKAARAILGAIAHLKGARDNHGRPLHAQARSFDVFCNTNKYESFVTAVTANQFSGGQTNPLAPLIAGGQIAINVVDDPDMAANNTAQFIVTRTDANGRKPLAWAELVTPEYSMLGADSEHFAKTNAYLWSTYGRWGMGYADPMCAARFTLATA